MDISENSWISDNTLHSINLTSDGNHYHSFYDQLLYFDTTVGVVKVKNYNYSLASSRLYQAENTDTTHIAIETDPFNYYGILNIPNIVHAKNLKNGDIFYTVSRTTGLIVDVANIISFSTNEIVLDAPVTIGPNIPCYADGDVLEIFGGSIVPKLSSGAYIEALTDATNLIHRWQKTTLTADVYIFFDNINGFSLNRY